MVDEKTLVGSDSIQSRLGSKTIEGDFIEGVFIDIEVESAYDNSGDLSVIVGEVGGFDKLDLVSGVSDDKELIVLFAGATKMDNDLMEDDPLEIDPLEERDTDDIIQDDIIDICDCDVIDGIQDHHYELSHEMTYCLTTIDEEDLVTGDSDYEISEELEEEDEEGRLHKYGSISVETKINGQDDYAYDIIYEIIDNLCYNMCRITDMNMYKHCEIRPIEPKPYETMVDRGEGGEYALQTLSSKGTEISNSFAQCCEYSKINNDPKG